MPAVSVSAVMGKPRGEASELRAVAPLVVLGGASPVLVGPCTLVTNGAQTIAFSSSELLRHAGEPLAICTMLDGSQTVAVTAWSMGRQGGIGLIELPAFTPTVDVVPLQIAAICASVDTRGAASGLVIFKSSGRGFARKVVSVYVDAIDGGGMSDDVITRLATPIALADVDVECDGATLFSWMPADPVLGRPSEVVAVALG